MLLSLNFSPVALTSNTPTNLIPHLLVYFSFELAPALCPSGVCWSECRRSRAFPRLDCVLVKTERVSDCFAALAMLGGRPPDGIGCAQAGVEVNDQRRRPLP